MMIDKSQSPALWACTPGCFGLVLMTEGKAVIQRKETCNLLLPTGQLIVTHTEWRLSYAIA